MYPYVSPDDLCLIHQRIKDLQDQNILLEKSMQTMMRSLVEITEAMDSLRAAPTTDGQQEAETIPEPEKLSDGETAETETAPRAPRKARAKKKDNSSSPTES
jgi:hypothetical protein